MVRFIHPDAEVRSAAGREVHIRTLQPLIFEVANSIFLGDYLTAEGQAAEEDLALIADHGFTVLGADEPTGDGATATVPAIRRRGAGTNVPANA